MYTMMKACRETGLTYQTLKFYCNEGLVPNVHRDKNNRRCFDEATVKWIKDLNCLKKCGMSIEEMKEYLALCLQGPSSIEKRRQILARKQEELQEQIDNLKESMSYIEWKQNFYSDVLTGKRPYVSNLIKVE
ncbi:MAG: MerR family transcriptional regulator [Acidaminococcaceae bacterium]|nr:MerR family transcriptional regulator [Acidaminococcaceae bacterium]